MVYLSFAKFAEKIEVVMLLLSRNYQIMEDFQKYNHKMLNSHSEGFQMPSLQSSSRELQASREEDLPQIFKIGGNKKLNKTLFYKRQQKLIEISSQSLIECEGLSKVYQLQADEEVVALRNITLKGHGEEGAIKRGQFVIIRGPSGGGKTTFLNLVGTIDKPTNGSLWIDGYRIDQTNKDKDISKLRRDKIGIVFQTFNLLALMSAYENIELPMRIKGELSEQEMRKRTFMLLKKVGLSERADHLPSELSGGEQQRVAIARSLANSPAIILLDQPTGDLDSKATVEVMNLILEINNFGYGRAEERITIVMVTHNQDLQCYGDRIIFFEDGKIKRQVMNDFQFALEADQYSKFLNTKV